MTPIEYLRYRLTLLEAQKPPYGPVEVDAMRCLRQAIAGLMERDELRHDYDLLSDTARRHGPDGVDPIRCIEYIVKERNELRQRIAELEKELYRDARHTQAVEADRDAHQAEAYELRQRVADLERPLRAIIVAIRDDAAAATYQTVGQYRSALLLVAAGAESEGMK